MGFEHLVGYCRPSCLFTFVDQENWSCKILIVPPEMTRGNKVVLHTYSNSYSNSYSKTSKLSTSISFSDFYLNQLRPQILENQNDSGCPFAHCNRIASKLLEYLVSKFLEEWNRRQNRQCKRALTLHQRLFLAMCKLSAIRQHSGTVRPPPYQLQLAYLHYGYQGINRQLLKIIQLLSDRSYPTKN